MTTLSIITVCKDDSRALALTAKSLSLQVSPPSYEWIIIDGASTDDTAERIAPYLVNHVTFISEPDNGLYDAMNKGLDRATGTYVWFMNAGDTFADLYVMRDVGLEIPRSIGADILYGDSREDGHIKPRRAPETIDQGLVTTHQAIIYRRETVGDLRFDTSLRIAADYLFTLFMFERAKRIHDFNRILCDFLPNGISQRLADVGRSENFTIRRDYLKTPAWRNHLICGKDRLTHKLKTRYPKLYWRLRSSKR